LLSAPDVRQACISAIAINQILFSILASAPALFAVEPNLLAGVLMELQRSVGHKFTFLDFFLR
jgi:hypothetical protein